MTKDSEIRRYRTKCDRRLAAATAAALAFCLCGCSSDDTAGPEKPVSWAVLSSRVHLVDEIHSPVKFEYAIDSTYCFRILRKPTGIDTGDIVIGTAGDGYIRRVGAVAVSGDRMILETGRARFTEGVLHGATAFEIPVGFGSMAAGLTPERSVIDGQRLPGGTARDYIRCTENVALSGGGIDISGLALFEGEISGYPASIRIDEGFIEFNPTVFVDMMIGDGAIEMLSSRVDGIYASDLALSIDVPGPLSIAGELPLASAGLKAVRYMGRVPVVALVELDFVLAYGFTGLFSSVCGAGFHDEIDMTLGALYELHRWMDISAVDPDRAATPLSCAEYSTSDMWVSIEPRIAVTLFGEPFAEMECGLRDGLTVVTRAPPDWEWSMSSALEGRCGIDPDALAPAPAGYEIDPLLLAASLCSGPYRTDSYIFVLSWGSEGSGDCQFSYPRGIATDASGDIYVVDSWNGRVKKFAPDSTLITAWGSEGSIDGQFLFPADVAVDRAGNIYVTDSGNDRVQKFGPDASFVTSWGGSGDGQGQFRGPEGIAVDPSGDVYVADSGNDRVQKFTPEGLFITEWGGYGTGPGMFDRPIGIAADEAGNIYVTECRNHRVQKFTSSGEALALWGSAGADEGEFDCPIAVAVDGEGFVYVVDYGNDRIQKLTAMGKVVTILGRSGTGEGGFDGPEGITIDRSERVYVVDSRNSRIQKFAPLH